MSVPRKYHITVLILSAILLILFGIEVSFFSAHADICSKNTYTGQKECATYGLLLFIIIEIGKFLDDHNGVILAFITGGLVWVARKQYKTSQAQLRAYLSVETGKYLRQSQKHRLHFEFRPTLKNNGQTPASNVRVVSRVDIDIPQISPAFNYFIPPQPGSVTTIGTGQDRFTSSVFPRNLTIPEMREIRKGTKCFHVWGNVTYTDIFKIERHTNFSYIIFVGGKRDMALWRNTEKHNDAD
jgi:hypothetical protein